MVLPSFETSPNPRHPGPKLLKSSMGRTSPLGPLHPFLRRRTFIVKIKGRHDGSVTRRFHLSAADFCPRSIIAQVAIHGRGLITAVAAFGVELRGRIHGRA